MEQIFKLKSIDELQTFLASQPPSRIRRQLAKAFLKVCRYRNAEEWNRAVRLCEALTIVGWGTLEPVEATRGISWNGGPETTFYNRFSQPRFVDAIWFKRKAGLTMCPGQTSYHASPDLPKKPTALWTHRVEECEQAVPLQTQRNWIPKNPVLICRGIANCYPKSEAVVAEVENQLMAQLDRRMRPELYGAAFNRLLIRVSLSYDDESGPCNYVLLDEDVRWSSVKLYAQLRKRYSAKEIERNGYFLRKRFDYGPFRADRGSMKVEIHFDKEFSQQSHKIQRREFATHLQSAVEGAIQRLKLKRPAYAFDAMRDDFQRILNDWLARPTGAPA